MKQQCYLHTATLDATLEVIQGHMNLARSTVLDTRLKIREMLMSALEALFKNYK